MSQPYYPMISTTPGNNDSASLTIMQINTNKLDDCMHNFLQNGNKAEVIAIQEPHIDFLGRTRALSHLQIVYPINHLDNCTKTPTRSLIMLDLRLATGSWTQLQVNSADVTAVQITGAFGTLQIFNIYNNGENDNVLEAVHTWTQSPEAKIIPKAPLRAIWLGNFN